MFFDEDIYIGIAQNLTRAPAAQITLLGGPDDAQVSSYYKEPSGWPVLLSLIFLVTGRSETVAFVVARVFFAIAIAAVYQLAREALETRRQAMVAAVLFGAAPVCFWFSPSSGADIPAALAVVLGLWGVFAGNRTLAAAGFAMAAQTRLELIVLLPLVWLSGRVSAKWKLVAAGLVSAEIVHIGWVLSIGPALAQAEKVSSAFGLEYVAGNLVTNLGYMFNPMVFPAGVTVLAVVGLVQSLRPSPGAAKARRPLLMAAPLLAVSRYRAHASRRACIRSAHLPAGEVWLLVIQVIALFGVYVLFYAGSFNLNPRYTIQILAPLALLAGSMSKRPILMGVLLVSMAIPYAQPLATFHLRGSPGGGSPDLNWVCVAAPAERSCRQQRTRNVYQL